MKKRRNINMDSEVYRRLDLALELSGDDEDEVFDRLTKMYISEIFGVVSQEYGVQKADMEKSDVNTNGNNEKVVEKADIVDVDITKLAEKVNNVQKINTKFVNSTKKIGDTNEFYKKALKKIPGWAEKSERYTHKIIRAFFEAEKINDKVSLRDMERMCSDAGNVELFVPTFKNNYVQMKIDTLKSNGKVFEDDGTYVWIWKEVEDTLRKYKSDFLR